MRSHFACLRRLTEKSKIGRRITMDFAISILASVIYTFARQIVVFPLLAQRLGESEYGTLLTIAGLGNVCVAVMGSTLNNVRLVQNSHYEDCKACGDFNRICLFGSGFSIVFAAALWKVFGLELITAVLMALYLVVSNFYQYATAFFRLELNFKRTLISNTLVSCAYVLAALIFATETLWPAIFLAGEGVGLLYVCRVTPFLREPFSQTPLMKHTVLVFLTLSSTNLINNLLTYADRMILYPVLGAASVSYYSTASFFGKSAGIVMTPIAGVLLGYFAQKNFRASKKLFALVIGISLGCLAVFLGGCWLFAPWFTRLLYPSLYDGAAPYIFLANLAAAISIAGNIAQPMVLKACSTHWLLATQILYGASYLLLSWLWLPSYGLLGFCWAAIISNSIRALALYAIGFIKF